MAPLLHNTQSSEGAQVRICIRKGAKEQRPGNNADKEYRLCKQEDEPNVKISNPLG